MSTLPNANRFAALDQAVPRDNPPGGTTPVVFLRPVTASNDPVSSDRAHDVESTPWPPVVAESTLNSWELYHAAREYRSYTLAEILAALAEAVAEGFGQARARWAQRQRARATRAALAELDDHTLRDLGLHRSEIGSLAAEASGGTERTRILAGLTGSGARM